MRVLLLFFTFFLFLVWTAFARYYYVCEIKNGCEGTPEVVTAPIERPKTLSLKYRDSILLESYEQFDFAKDSTTADLTENNTAFLFALSKYLQENKDRLVKITGLYRISESGLQQGNFENLGLARAAAIQNELIALGVAPDQLSLDYDAADTENLYEPLLFTLMERETDSDN